MIKKYKETFLTSLKLGLTSFGGPIAHLGYFERTYVKDKKWLSHEQYSEMVALCQLLPGPSSSQVNFLIGLRHAGWLGALLSWAGFTLPSALFLFLFAFFASSLHGPYMEATLHGLKLVAVAIVAQALWGMATKLCPDKTRAGIALIGMAIILLIGGAFSQIAVIGFGALCGWWLCSQNSSLKTEPQNITPTQKKLAWGAFSLFCALLFGLPVLMVLMPSGLLYLIDISFRSGALVFGGGHVVLPLLRDAMVPTGMMSDDTFLAGYGLAQAVPGPLFTLSAYLGAAATPAGHSAFLWGTCALIFIFLPGILTALAGLPLWQWVSKHQGAQNALIGINASVVGILGAAFYNPVWTSAILSKTDFVIAVIGYFLLEKWKVPPILIVAFCVIAAITAHIFSL